MCVRIERERPLVNRAAAPVVAERRELRCTPDAIPHTARVRVDEPRNECAIAECGRQEDVGRRAPVKKKADHLSRVANQPLHGCGLVVFITCLDTRASLEEQACGRLVTGEMQWSTRVAAFCVDERGIGVEHAGKVIGETKPRGGVHGQRRPAVNQRPRRHGIDLAGMETGRPPVTDGLQIVRRP